MTKTKNKLRIIGLLLATVLLMASLGFFSLTASATDGQSVTDNAPTEPTDVYWRVHSGKLLLSAEQGSSGYYKWSKESIAAVNNASSVPWNSSRDEITSVIIYDRIAPPSLAFWFQDTNLTSFSATAEGAVYLDMSFATDVQRMFAGCSQLTELDLTGTSAPLVKNIESAFDGCSSLKALDISFLDGAPINNMMNAFYGCSALKALDISCLDGAPISEMTNAFYGCSRLEALDVSGLDVSRVTDFAGVFFGCSSLKSLDLSALDGRKITTLADSFNGCESLTSLTFGDKFTCENVTNMKNTFRKCLSLTALDLSYFSTAKVTDMSYAFAYCEALGELTLGTGFVCSAVTDMNSTFAYCKALESIDTSGWGAVGVKNMKGLFNNCSSLESLDLSGFSEAKPTDISAMLSGVVKMKSIDLADLDTSEVTAISSLFEGCTSLEYFDLSSIDTAAVTKMDSLFQNCNSLTSFSFNGVNTSQVETLDSMFNGCSNLASVDLSGLDSSKVTSMSAMFYGCSSLLRLDLSELDITEGLDPTFIVRGCTKLEVIDAPKSIPESASISLSPYTFYTGEAEITELTSENQGKSVVKKHEIKYFRKDGTYKIEYDFEPNYYYYGYGATITATVTEAGYTFGGWTKKDSDVIITEITESDTGDFYLYAKLTAFQPITPTVSGSADVTVTYGEGFEVKVSFDEEELHTYTVRWYRTPFKTNTGGTEVSDIRNTLGFTIEPKRFDYGIEIEKEVYFYCTVTATRTDNGLTKTASSAPIKVYVERAQAEITVHPEAIKGLVYSGSAQAVSTYGESTYGSVSYSFYETDSYGNFNNKQTKAGVGILYYRVFDGIYYKGTGIYTLEYEIEAATPTVLWDTETKTVDYTGSEASIGSPSVYLLGSDTYNGAISYSYTGTSSGTGLPVNAGTYSVIASIAADGNYKEASSEALTLVINKAEPSFNKKPTSISALVYNGDEQVLVNGGEAVGGILEFSLDKSSWSSDLPKGKDAGIYSVYYRIKGDSNHSDSATGSLYAEVGKKNITVTADDIIICVNSSYTLTYSVEGLVYDEPLPIEVNLSTEAAVGTVGVYDVTASGAEASDNYIITYENGTLTVRDHAYDNGTVTATATCTKNGEMTYTCSHDKAHTRTEPLPIDENAHSWDEGKITDAPSCTEKGVKTFTCKHNSEHTYTEDVDELGHSPEQIASKPATCTESGLTAGTKCSECGEILVAQTEIAATGHKYDNGCDATCNVCTEARASSEHSDADEDGICDECSAEFTRNGLSGGAVAGIVIASAAVIGLGVFLLFRFVIKKKVADFEE